jgi:uncharacterized membrane protein
MGKYVQVVVDNATTFTGLLTAIFGVLAAFGVDLTSEQVGSVTTVFGILVIVLGLFLAVAKRRVVTMTQGDAVVAGPAAQEKTGTPVPTALSPAGDVVAFATVANPAA